MINSKVTSNFVNLETLKQLRVTAKAKQTPRQIQLADISMISHPILSVLSVSSVASVLKLQLLPTFLNSSIWIYQLDKSVVFVSPGRRPAFGLGWMTSQASSSQRVTAILSFFPEKAWIRNSPGYSFGVRWDEVG